MQTLYNANCAGLNVANGVNYGKGSIPGNCSAPSTGLSQLTLLLVYISTTGFLWSNTSGSSKIPARKTALLAGSPDVSILCP